jgi:chemotaxis protein histidine kinase CheA
MNIGQREHMLQKGFDIDGTMKRFLGNEPLYIKCLKKFPDDKSYENLKRAYSDNDCVECFKYAHTMKGLVSNLGINEMYHFLIPMVDKLRSGDMDISKDLEQFDVLYKETCDIIKEL